ncbi:centrosomal protein of 164 kDa [Culicoides brevitarsis]|uniref:centrosomal protein of 164 kDa n=1 Tax=Culicoides brevitarsis TaxID=469753 RepID=UPI00307C1097
MSSEIENNLSSSANNLSSSVILKEEFDEGFEPTKEEIRDYAIKIGIRPDEPHLLHLARDGLMRALPSNWKPCFDEKHQAHYYVNKETKKTQWEHPLDAEYKLLVEKARRKYQDQSDTLSELDSGIRSLQGNDVESDSPEMKVEQTIFGPPRPGLLPITGRDRIQLQPLDAAPAGPLRPVSAAISRKVGKFEVTKSSLNAPTKIDLSMKTDSSQNDVGKPPFMSFSSAASTNRASETSPKKGFALQGGGSLFLKSNTRRQSDVGTPSMSSAAVSNPIDISGARSRESGSFGMSPNIMKGILRDSSLTDVRSRPQEMKIGGLDFETTTDGDRKIVRFNLNPAEIRANSEENDDEGKVKSDNSSEEEQSVEEEEEDVWDFINNDTAAGNSGINNVKQVKVTPAISPISPITQLAILKSGQHANETIKKTTVKAIVAKNEMKDKPSIFSMFDKMDKKDEKGSFMVKPLYDESESDSSGQIKSKESDAKLHSFEQEVNKASNYKELETMLEDEKQKFKDLLDMKLQKLQQQQSNALEKELKNEEIKFKELLETKRKSIEEQHLQDVLKCKKEAESKLNDIKNGVQQQNEEEIEAFRAKLEAEFEAKRKKISEEYKIAAETLQKNHNEMLDELNRDLKLEQEIIKKEHSQKLAQMRTQVEHEIQMERQRLRETGEDRLYEKVRCEKRLLEDKYRCLKEKYVRLKNDVKISLERRNRRREQTSITTTGSETERTPSNNRDASQTGEFGKPPMGIVSSAKQKLHLQEATGTEPPTQKHLKFLQQQQNQDETSISQSDTTISNNYNRRQHLNIPFSNENGNSDSEAFVRSAPKTSHQAGSNNNNNNFQSVGRQKRKVFTRSKSASTSRLHTSLSQEQQDRPCTPVENLRVQLQKLEDLEDQFPENTLDTPYKLRYPFSDIGNQAGGSGELEFIKHRIHLEKDSVRRAKESLRTQRTTFRAKQREIKQRHAASVVRHTMDQLYMEEKELTEMEVSLHRTRALLGEKVIRLRHLEHSLQRVYEKEKPLDLQSDDNKLNRKEDATLSDVSSHSSSGFSSTDMNTDTLQGQRKDLLQESSEIMHSLENLNAEIREIWDILSKQQIQGLPAPPAPTYEQEIKWTMFGPAGSPTTTVPSLQDRLETYRHITGRNTNPFLTSPSSVANSVPLAPLAAHYTSSLVERTRDLRNWLKQAKTENEVLATTTNRGGQQTTI